MSKPAASSVSKSVIFRKFEANSGVEKIDYMLKLTVSSKRISLSVARRWWLVSR